MNIQDFFDKYNGKGLDFDGYYGFQCMDLYQQYNKEVIGGPHIPANASEVWTNYPKDLYSKIENTPEGIPEKGDVIIWNNQVGGGYGHIAICSTADVNSFVSFDQNWPVGTVCHFQNHVYNNVLGWLKPKGDIISEDMPTYLKTLLQENNLADESSVREFFEKARRYNGLKTDFDNCQILVDQKENTIAKLTKDLQSLPTSPPEAPKTADYTWNGLLDYFRHLIKKNDR